MWHLFTTSGLTTVGVPVLAVSTVVVGARCLPCPTCTTTIAGLSSLLLTTAVPFPYFTQGVTTSYDSITLTDNINILFRQQTQLFGKTLFLTVYALIIAFLFLPASLLTKQQGILASLRATYVISEQEHRILVKTRLVTVRFSVVLGVALFCICCGVRWLRQCRKRSSTVAAISYLLRTFD
jgi:uncharacterized paraquat-inducible protein A